LEEVRKLSNPIQTEARREILIFDLRKVDSIRDFVNPELRAAILLLKIIRYPREKFIEGWNF
jgi:hypothetical protein